MSTFAVLWIGLMLPPMTSRTSAPVPKDDEKRAEREKAVKEVVGKFVTALGKKDVDGLVDISDFPWCQGLGIIAKDKEQLREHLKAGLQEKPFFDAKYQIKRLETFASAQKRLAEVEVKALEKVLADEDYVIHVEVEYPKRKIQVRLMMKLKDGKPRLVGTGTED